MSNSLEPSKRGFLSFRETRKTSECEKNGRKLLHRSVHSFQFARSPQQGEKIEAEKWLTRRKKMFCAQILFFVTDHWSKLFEFLFMCLWDVWDSLLSLSLSLALSPARLSDCVIFLSPFSMLLLLYCCSKLAAAAAADLLALKIYLGSPCRVQTKRWTLLSQLVLVHTKSFVLFQTGLAYCQQSGRAVQ